MVVYMRSVLLTWLLLCGGPAYSWSAPEPLHASQQRTITESQAASAALRAVPGKVLGVQKIQNGERVLYKVKILTDDGRVRIVTVDGSTGNVLSR